MLALLPCSGPSQGLRHLHLPSPEKMEPNFWPRPTDPTAPRSWEVPRKRPRCRAPRSAERLLDGTFGSGSDRERSLSRILHAWMIFQERRVLQQLLPICTPWLNPIQGDSHLNQQQTGPHSLRDKLACDAPNSPHRVGSQRSQLHNRSCHSEWPSPANPQHAFETIHLHEVRSKCAADPIPTSKRCAFCAQKSSSANRHLDLSPEKATIAPPSCHTLATKASSWRNAPAAASPSSWSPRPHPGEAELLDHRTPGGGLGSRHLQEGQRTAPADQDGDASDLPSSGAAAELRSSGPSWRLTGSRRTGWRCLAAWRPPRPTWRRGAPGWCWRSPGCHRPAESWLPSLQQLLQPTDLPPNLSSKCRCPQGNPSNICCRSSSLGSHTEDTLEHALHLAKLRDGDPPTCSPWHHAAPRSALYRRDQSEGKGQTDAPNPTVMAPVHPTAPVKSMENGLGVKSQQNHS